MACLDMYNSEHKMNHHHHHHHHHQYHHHHNHNHLMQVSPRISFSNDFVDAQQAMRQELTRASARTETASSDFEFSVTNYSMMSADELFFKGRLLPFKDNTASNNTTSSQQPQRTTTLRDELLQGDDDVTFRPAKGSSSSSSTGTRWKSLLGLKRAHGGSHSKKAAEKAMLHEEAHVSNASQEVMNEDVEIGI